MKKHLSLLFLALAATVALRATPAAPARESYVMHFDSDWKIASGLPEKAMLIGLQGIANRAAPRLYIVHAADFPWEITGPLKEFYERIRTTAAKY